MKRKSKITIEKREEGERKARGRREEGERKARGRREESERKAIVFE
jgi:hypothetical protein